MLAAERHRRTGDQPLQFGEGDHGPGKGDGADHDTQTHLDTTGDKDISGRADQAKRPGVGKSRTGHQHRGHTDQTVESRYQLRHGGHGDAFGDGDTDHRAEHQRRHNPFVGLHFRAEHGGHHRDQHAEHAADITGP